MQKRPKSLTCYICGREFGTTSLGIHIPQCQKKFINNESLKPPGQRRKLPQEPGGLQQTLQKAQKGQIDYKDIEDFRNQNLENYYENVLVPCQNCGRTFQDDRLVVHLRSCKPKSNNIQKANKQQQQQQPKYSQYPQQKEIQKPRTLVCYICGREYGTTSLKIHIPQCQKKFINNENLKPKNQRKPLPEPPADLMRLINTDNISRNDLEDYNKTAYEKYNNDVLQECPNCGRTFLEDRLQVHLRSCKSDNPAKKKSIGNYGQNHEEQDNYMSVQNKQNRQPNNVTFKNNQINEQTFGKQKQQFQMNDDAANMNLVCCNICGRKFNSDRIDQHQKICQKAQQKDKKRQKIMDLKNKRKQMEMKSVIMNEKRYENKMKSDIKAVPRWKQQHEQLISAMKYMRQVKAAEQKGIDIRDIQPPPSQENYNQDYVGCPHCGRKFNQQVAERHIPKCKNIINKPKAPPKRNQQMKPPPSQNQQFQQKSPIPQKQNSSQKPSNSHRQSEVNRNTNNYGNAHQNTNFAMKQQVRMEQRNQQSIRNQNEFASNHIQNTQQQQRVSQMNQQQQRMSQANQQQQRMSQANQQMNNRQRVTPNNQQQQQPSTNQYQRQQSNNQQQKQGPNSYQRMHSNNAKAREQQNQGVFGQQKGYKFKY